MKPLFLPKNLDLAEDLLGVLRDVAGTHDAKPAQVALAWLIRQPNVIVIPGASSVAQLEFNAAAADLELTDDDDQRLRRSQRPVPAGQRSGRSLRPGADPPVRATDCCPWASVDAGRPRALRAPGAGEGAGAEPWRGRRGRRGRRVPGLSQAPRRRPAGPRRRSHRYAPVTPRPA